MPVDPKSIRGRRTIRPNVVDVPADPLNPIIGSRANRSIRMWDLASKPGSTVSKLSDVYLSALDAVDRTSQHKAAALKSGKFTPQGVNDDVFNFALGNTVSTFKRGRNVIAAAKQEAAKLRQKVKLQPADKSDVAGAMLRQELRTMLRSMPDDERGKYLAKNIEGLDPTIALAILEAPAELTRVPETFRAQLTERALIAQHGTEVLQEIQDLERAIEIAESAVETGRDEVRLETGVTDLEFDRCADPIEKKLEAPWLKRCEEDGQVVIRKLDWDEEKQTGGWPKATPEDIATGIIASTREEYQQAKSAFKKVA